MWRFKKWLHNSQKTIKEQKLRTFEDYKCSKTVNP
jgi:hypothetical protein